MQARSPLCPKERPEVSVCSPRRQVDASAAQQRPTGAGPASRLYLERSSWNSAAAAAPAEAAAATLSGRRRTLAAKGKRLGGAAGTLGAAAGGSSSTEPRADSAQPQSLLL